MENIDPRIKYNWKPSGLGEALYGKSKKRKSPEPAVSGLAYGLAAEWEEAAVRNKKQKLKRAKPEPHRTLLATARQDCIVIDDDDEPLPYEPPKASQPEPRPGKRHTGPSPQQPPTSNICTCGNEANAAAGIVQCINGRTCKMGRYHASCVGLADRPPNPTWRCRDCRPPPPPTSSQPSSSQPPSKSSLDARFSALQEVPPAEPPPAEPAPLVTAGPPEPPLHPEQEKVVRRIEDGHNVFYTGSAGTGKSTVLKAFVQRLKSQGKQVDIVAPSGIAALNVGGMTIFSYAYWHPDSFKEGLDVFLRKAHGKSVRKRLCKTDVLVIDEISMVERDLLVRLDLMMREVRHGWRGDEDSPRRKLKSPHDRKLPFGGAQLVVTGDFCQLPPVKPFKHCIQCGGGELIGWNKQDGKDLRCKTCPRIYSDADKWAFRSRTWEDCGFQYFELKRIHRQNDQQFISILQKCRVGQRPSAEQEAILTKAKPDPVGAVKLLPRRAEVENENLRNFSRLPGQVRDYDCLDYWEWRSKDEPDLQKKGKRKYPNKPDGPLLALNDHRFEEKVQLKVGMLVILLVNMDFSAGLVNGSQGKIVRFQKYDPSQPLIAKDKVGGHPEWSAMDILREAQIRSFIERAVSTCSCACCWESSLTSLCAEHPGVAGRRVLQRRHETDHCAVSVV